MKRGMTKNVRLLELHTILLNGMFIVPVIMPYYLD